jgi:ATP synthase protein I
MSDRDRDPDNAPKSDDALADRLRRLDRRLEAHRGQAEPAPRRAGSGAVQGMGQALRLASEFVAGILVGAGLGWLIDWWLGTSPWGLIVFLLLGFVAGVLNVLRAAGLVRQPEGPGPGRPDGKTPPTDLAGRRD